MKQADSLSLVNGMEALKQNLKLDLTKEYGTRDKSWGVRPVENLRLALLENLMLNQEYIGADSNKFWRYFYSFGTFEDHDGNSTQLLQI